MQAVEEQSGKPKERTTVGCLTLVHLSGQPSRTVMEMINKHERPSNDEIREILRGSGAPRDIWILGHLNGGSGDGLMFARAFVKRSRGFWFWKRDVIEEDSLVTVEWDHSSTIPDGYWALVWL